MKFLLMHLFCFLTFAMFLHSYPPIAKAITEFTTNYQGLYQIQEDGATYITHTITITNNQSHLFPREYTISVGNTDLAELQAIDGNGHQLTIKKTQTENQTNLNITLQKPNIGQNQVNIIKITYKTKDIVIKNGTSWEINIPRLKQSSNISSLERIIVFPNTLGSPTIAIPSPDEIKTDTNTTSVFYRTNRHEPISLLFGESQWYHLTLDYYIKKPLSKNTVTEISLPPDTNYQRVVINKITPPPSEIVIDQDGNWLARYPYSEDFTSHIVADLFVQVSPIPIFFDPSSTHLPEYTKPTKYWETNSTIVKQTAEQLKNTENIYNYLTSSFAYNKNRVTPTAERLGAAKALTTPSMAICTEYTDAFIALARAIGIPAREINGYAFTQNNELRPLSLATDVLHAWPEYLDKDNNSWRSIDPTWGNTTNGLNYYKKLDYNHIVFVRHGLDPTYPYPAGTYKESLNNKTINVLPLTTPPTINKQYTINQTSQGYLITNTGNIALTNEKLNLPDGSSQTITYLPPFSSHAITNTQTKNSSLHTILILLGASFLFLIVIGVIIYLTKSHKPPIK